MAKKSAKKKKSVKAVDGQQGGMENSKSVFRKKVPGAFRILQDSLRHLWRHRKIFGGISLVYLLLTLLLVKGLSAQINIAEIRDSLGGVLGGGELITGLTLFGILLGNSADAGSEVGATYQSVLLIIISLATIWALRQTYANKPVGTKEVFYKAMYPLIPFVLVLLVIGLQLIPLALASSLYAIVMQGGLAVTAIEQVLWVVLFLILALVSLYMVSSSIFALYIVTLPDMMPMKAIRSAKEIVRGRRWSVIRKVLFLPVALLVCAALIMLPIILYVSPLAEWVFFVLATLGLPVVHGYFYALYREIL